jgi:hypothetical protein
MLLKGVVWWQVEQAGNSTESMTGRGRMCEFLLTLPLSLSLSRNVATSSCLKRKQTSFFRHFRNPAERLSVCMNETTPVRINRFRLSLNCRVSRQKWPNCYLGNLNGTSTCTFPRASTSISGVTLEYLSTKKRIWTSILGPIHLLHKCLNFRDN